MVTSEMALDAAPLLPPSAGRIGTGIPLVDLRAQYATIKAEIDDAIAEVIADSAFIGGRHLLAFEADFAAFCDAAACVGVGNGTDALYLALRALGVGRGDEVVTVAYTFVATVESIGMTGAKPVFVDIDESTLLLDPAKLESAITPNTKAIVAVHLYGHPCDMDAVCSVAKAHGLLVVEDAAQAHGARWHGRRVGGIGDVACFSFYPSKNLGAFGDAGAVVSNDAELVERIRMLANHGRRGRYLHDIEGVNSRLDGLQAAILRVKLRHLDSWNHARRDRADRYLRQLAGLDLALPVIQPDTEPVWHQFVVRTADRDQLAAVLKAAGIATGFHYAVTLHCQPAYAHLGMPPGGLPVTDRAAAGVLSLPIYAELADEQIDLIVDTIRDAL